MTVSTNPCGEIPLCPYDSCRLLALNLLSYVDNPFKKDAKFNFDKFRSHVAMAMRMMDDIIDLELEKVEQIIEKIAADPEDEDVRRVELELWKKILGMAQRAAVRASASRPKATCSPHWDWYTVPRRRSHSPSRCRRRWPSRLTGLR